MSRGMRFVVRLFKAVFRTGIFSFVFATCISAANAQEMMMTTTLNELKNLLNDYSVRDDLELTDEQLEQLNPLMRQMLVQFSDLQRELDQSVSDDARELVTEKLNSAFVAAKSTLEEVLLPHQLARLNQIHQQKRIEPLRDATFGLIKLSDELELTDKQIKEVEIVAKRNDQLFQKRINEMRSEIIEMRSNMRVEVMQILTDEQRQQYDRNFGVEFLKPYWITHWFTTNQKEKSLRSGSDGRTKR